MITTRQSIADALSAVDGVTGYPKKPKAVKVGDAWPLVQQLDRGPGASFQTTWRIAVVLGSDVATATDKLDDLVPEATQALQAEAYVDLARPVEIPTEAGPMYGVEIIARSE
jgi:hypothetical protein